MGREGPDDCVIRRMKAAIRTPDGQLGPVDEAHSYISPSNLEEAGALVNDLRMKKSSHSPHTSPNVHSVVSRPRLSTRYYKLPVNPFRTVLSIPIFLGDRLVVQAEIGEGGGEGGREPISEAPWFQRVRFGRMR